MSSNKIAEILKSHIDEFRTSVVQEGKFKLVYQTDLQRVPAIIQVTGQDTESGRMHSFSFKEAENSRTKTSRIAKIEKFIAQVVKAGAYENPKLLDDETVDTTQFALVHADEVIKLFGLFGTQSQLGEDAFVSFIKRLEQSGQIKAKEHFLSQKDVFVRTESARMRTAFAETFESQIHSDALKAVKVSDSYDWDVLGFYSRQDEPGMLRRQAAEAYPLLAKFFANNSSFTRRFIHRKKPLGAELANIFETKEKMLKRLRAIKWPMNGLTEAEIIKNLSKIPPDWFPKTKEEWDSFCILTKTVGRLQLLVPENALEFLYKGSKGKWRELHLRCIKAFRDTRPPEGLPDELANELKEKIDWKALEKAQDKSPDELSRAVDRALGGFVFPSEEGKEAVREWLERSATPDFSEQHMAFAHDSCLEMINFIRDHVVVPAGAHAALAEGNMDNVYLSSHQLSEARELAFRLVAAPDPNQTSAGKSVTNILENVRYFLNDMAAIYEKVVGNAELISTANVPEGEWPPLFRNLPEAPNGIYFEPLTSSKSLSEEGSAMNHCVGGYSSACKSSFNHIVSMRRKLEDGEFERFATIQFEAISVFDTPITHLPYRQFYAQRNQTPGPEAQEAMDWFRNEVRKGRIDLNLEIMEAFQRANGSIENLDHVERLCGYKWSKKDQVNDAMFAVGRLIHRNVTKDVRNVDDLIGHEIMEPLKRRMDPVYGASQERKDRKAALQPS